MAKLINISFIRLHTNPTGDMGSTGEARSILKENGVVATELGYVEGPSTLDLYSALSSWTWGRTNERRSVNQLPLLTWRECYDDGWDVDRIACGLDEMQNCDLWANKNLITQENE